ncbi:hypothetical protein BO226_22125 [Rhodococcus sp. 2G]|uniref:helix-turn-helix domain-containing protein n=1 Tax=Rhodococcus sp. 2G TaxID=1570939 RepID=UPI0009039F8D|nr:helix-turn-helix domain-containing protein [Rhodococcus sp. 2G]APE11568.1 hypothetical protein BO226_22125 [Rhodococcus sp. 2G]
MTLPRLMVPSRTTVAVLLAAIAAAAVAGTSFWRSFTAIAELAVAYQVPVDQAWMIPVAVDGLVVVATVAAAVARHRIARGYSWALLVAGTVVSVAGNGIHAWQLTESPIGVGIAVIPPLVTLAAVHLTILLARQDDSATQEPRRTTRDDTPTTDETPEPQPVMRPVTQLRVAPATPSRPAATLQSATPKILARDVAPPPATDDLAAKAVRLVAEGMSYRTAGDKLGVSKDKVSRWVNAHRRAAQCETAAS